MGLSPFVVFISLLAWGYILGGVGMFMAVPLTMALKIVMESDQSTLWIATLMGSGVKKPPGEEAEPAVSPAPGPDSGARPLVKSDS